MFQTYYRLTKPGIIYGNLITATAGFCLAAQGDIQLWLFIAMILGLGLVMASGCVFNNYIDRHLDKKMSRTSRRALVRGTISIKQALTYASILGTLGLTVLFCGVNTLAAAIAFGGLVIYVVVYAIAKRRSSLGTVVGSFAGAVPPVVGYTAVTSHFDMGALLLFLILVTWQMPHFYAIALYRLKDYAAAGIPVLPIVKGANRTKQYVVIYIMTFITAALLLTVTGYTGLVYTIAMAVIGIVWLKQGIAGFKIPHNEAWAKKMFRFSLIVLMTFSVLLMLSAILP